MSFSDNLKSIRKEKHISQEDLAELLNVSRQAVSKWEQGAGFPEMEKMIILSKELDVSLDTLVYGKSNFDVSQEINTDINRKIMIRFHNKVIIGNCYKILSFPVSKKKNEPHYALFGVDGQSLLDENRVFLGWYANQDSITKEIDAVWAALEKGEFSYELKYTVKVRKKFLSIKLDE